MPRLLVAEASGCGFALEPDAAPRLVERMGVSPVRLAQRAGAPGALGGEGGRVTREDLDAMVADTSEADVWSLADALLERDARRRLRIAERLIAQGENVTGMIYGLASRLRGACAAAGSDRGGRAAEAGRILASKHASIRCPASWSLGLA